MTQKTFSFSLPLANPDAVRLLKLKDDLEARLAAEGNSTPADAWKISPQADGVWIHGTGAVPEAMLITMQEFIKSTGAIEEVAFTFSDPQNNSGGIVMANADGYQKMNLKDYMDDFLEVSREALRARAEASIPGIA